MTLDELLESDCVFIPTYDEIQKKMADHYHYIPVAYPIHLDHAQWFSLYQKINERHSYHVLLESGRAGRYSIMAYAPSYFLQGKNDQLTIRRFDHKGHIQQKETIQGNLLDSIQTWTSKRRAPRFLDLPDFCGGLLGFLSYDLVREIESLPSLAKDDLSTPDLAFYVFEQILLYDHQEKQHWLVCYQAVEQKESLKEKYVEGQNRLLLWYEELQKLIQEVAEESSTQEATLFMQNSPGKQGAGDVQGEIVEQHQDMIPSFSEEGFITAVQKVQEYISAGDVFQINLSVRQSKILQSKPLDVYKELREINPSPYMGYLHFPEFQLISASPEQLIKLQGGQLNTRPIAGTRPRGGNREEDLRLAEELIHNEKERAEHVMLVDLERNDLGKVCQFGSVEVDEFMVIEEYSHVMHIVSNVKGTIAEEKDAIDVIRAVFPGGTITGAPKVRTMEIIEELEPVRRGIYTGSIGWIDYNGDMELNIVIRTMLAQNGIAHVQAGAGIVIDSIPVNEYKESLKKAEALWKALEQSKKNKKELSV